jgi:hypothetical protein
VGRAGGGSFVHDGAFSGVVGERCGTQEFLECLVVLTAFAEKIGNDGGEEAAPVTQIRGPTIYAGDLRAPVL